MRLLENRDAGGRNYCTSTTQAERIEKGQTADPRLSPETARCSRDKARSRPL